MPASGSVIALRVRPCLSCGFDPVDPADKARGLLLCDHHMSAENLRAIAKQIKAGKTLIFLPS